MEEKVASYHSPRTQVNRLNCCCVSEQRVANKSGLKRGTSTAGIKALSSCFLLYGSEVSHSARNFRKQTGRLKPVVLLFVNTPDRL